MIEVVVERSHFHFGLSVWLFERMDGGVRVYSADGRNDQWLDANSEEKGEPMFRIAEQHREALGAALLGQTMPTDSMARHLADAIATRDRLLALVEHLTDRSPA